MRELRGVEELTRGRIARRALGSAWDALITLVTKVVSLPTTSHESPSGTRTLV